MSDAGLRIGYFDGSALARLAADPGPAGRLAAELVTAMSVATTSELSLAEVPHHVRQRLPDMVDVARVAWPWLLNELTVVQLEGADLEEAGASGWTIGEPCASVHLAVAAKIGASDYVTADAESADRALRAGMAVAQLPVD